MNTELRVLADAELTQIHERSLKILAETGVRVDTQRGRTLLKKAGAWVDEKTCIVRFPRNLVEDALKAAPRQFALGGRRPGWSLPMNSGLCALLLDGAAIHTYDAVNGTRRPASQDDWLQATHLSDALDEFGGYWRTVDFMERGTPADEVAYWRLVFSNFSKHVQDATDTPQMTPWMLEVLQVVFGGRETIRQQKPVSIIICPTSPLIIEREFTDAYLEAAGWGLPVAVMTMPLMGTTAPGTLISMLILCNCETLAMLCLAQAAEPGAPFIYAPAASLSNPFSGRYGSGEVEHSLTGAAVTEMARFYGLPVMSSTGGSDQHAPSIQAGYERALNWLLPVLSRPDLLVGPGVLGGTMIFSPEQLMIDLEVFRRCQRLRRGIECGEEKWLDDVIQKVGQGGNYMTQRSTRTALRAGELHISRFGFHEPFERWESDGKPDILAEARQKLADTIAAHQPLPLDETVLRELDKIEKRAREADA
jgi:trimethylamine--corrinoid protein Co-methyltransferase